MKKITDIDPNFRLPDNIPRDMAFSSIFEAPFQLYGVAQNPGEVLCRLPVSMLPRCNEGVRGLAYHLAGACIRFATDARQLAVLWELRETGNMPHFAASGQSGMELFEETDAGTREICNIIPNMEDDGRGCRQKQSRCVTLPGKMRHYVLYLPLYNGIREMQLGFPAEASVLPGRTPGIINPIVFYGSSITQGGCAGKAGACYSTILCRRLDAAQLNLGFSGSARGESVMAEYIASLPMSVFVMDYDHNAPDEAHLERTHEPFFRIIRKAQPTLPVVMVTRPDFDAAPASSAARRDIVRRTYEHALQEGDCNVYFVDGETLFGGTDRDLCAVDGTHPNDLGFLRMADRMEPVLRTILHK